MTEFIIIKGTINSGKTTTAGMVYKELLPRSAQPHYFNKRESFTNGLIICDEYGSWRDFSAELTINNKTIAIVSAGDVRAVLKKEIEYFLNKNVNVLIICLRTYNRQGSSRQMVYTDYPDYPKTEFLTPYSRDICKREEIKKDVVKLIVEKINSLVL